MLVKHWPKTGDLIHVRPWQLLCVICSNGAADGQMPRADVGALLDRISRSPEQPLCVRCRSGDVFAYQDAGCDSDGPGGPALNRWRDMETLCRLRLAPGAILPARILLNLVLKAISSVSDLCGDPAAESEAWRGCGLAQSGAYQRRCAKGIDAIIAPRGGAEMARDKEASLKDMFGADSIRIRPHILLCAVEQYGGGIRPPYAPDNLPEMIQHILARPDTPITLVEGADWLMCGPCPSRAAACSGCVVGGIGSGGLYNELKDLNVLRALGLDFGVTLRARELCALIFERIPSVIGICSLDPGIEKLSVWRDGCGQQEHPCPNYEKGRALLMQEFNP